jgi:hypothetical protein
MRVQHVASLVHPCDLATTANRTSGKRRQHRGELPNILATFSQPKEPLPGQGMLGHAKLETTAIYTQVAIRELNAVYDGTHPGQHEADDDPGSLDV